MTYNLFDENDRKEFVKTYVLKYIEQIGRANLKNITKADLLYFYDQLMASYSVDLDQILFDRHSLKKYLLEELKEIHKI